MSLDARKAFDSVDHGYITRTLKKYGFGPMLIKYFKVLYNNVSAKIMIKDDFPLLEDHIKKDNDY